MRVRAGNLFADLPAKPAAEHFAQLLSAPHVTIERIVSYGQSSPADFWYDQDRAEWVMLVRGSAAILLADETVPRELKAGDYLHIPAHTRHRVVRTDPDQATIWLAVYYG
jgi:cupin 2 domain-containing protein